MHDSNRVLNTQKTITVYFKMNTTMYFNFEKFIYINQFLKKQFSEISKASNIQVEILI